MADDEEGSGGRHCVCHAEEPIDALDRLKSRDESHQLRVEGNSEPPAKCLAPLAALLSRRIEAGEVETEWKDEDSFGRGDSEPNKVGANLFRDGDEAGRI